MEPQVDRFQIISRLGAGGFGEAFRAWDRELGTPVVLKKPLAKHLSRSEVIVRFDREIDRLCMFSHPHIVPIVDHGHDRSGLPYLAMRFLPAGSLADRKKPQSLPFLHQWLPAVADALDYVHGRGVLHRDVKPANIFFDTDTKAFLGDFGIAKIIDEELAFEYEQSLTATGGAIGTYPYMAPEFFRQPRILSGAYDQYALAITVYEMLCGQRPFSGDSGQLIVAHVTQDPPDIRDARRDVPASLCQAVARALAKKPEQRYPSCSAFAEAVLRDISRVRLDESYRHFLCPGCHTLVRVPQGFGGRNCRCPACSCALQVSWNCDALWRQEEAPLSTKSRHNTFVRPDQELLCNSIGVKLCRIPAGTFMMGASDGAAIGQSMRQVRISRDYYLGQTPVTQGQWLRVMGEAHRNPPDPQHPVYSISWGDAVSFCRRLSERPEEKAAGHVYRLPTEAEWEHACRAGTDTRFCFGDQSSRLVDYAWFRLDEDAVKEQWGNGEDGSDEDLSAYLAVYGSTAAHAVGEKKPNRWGLYDMHGNVSEWCSDLYGEYGSHPVTDPVGPLEGSERVSRGGGWSSSAAECTAASRQYQPAATREPSLGFRVVLTRLRQSEGHPAGRCTEEAKPNSVVATVPVDQGQDHR